jgi:UDP-N-acetylglucosamine 2-epimerase (non-hydrolysing)
MKRVLSVVGTRPEAIKMAPVIKRLAEAPWCESRVVATAQHRELLDQVFSLFRISADIDLDIMRERQTLAALTARLFERLDGIYDSERPDMVLAQGDTTTVMVASLAAFYRGIAFGHVEAGLRTYDLRNPFPEELNRVIAGRVATLHFAPTEIARKALLREGVPDVRIVVTGNTVIDALLEVAAQDRPCPVPIPPHHRVILLTAHRRESFGEPMRRVFRAVRALVARFPDVEVIFPVHPNPHVRTLASEVLGGLDRVHLVEPMSYGDLVATLKRTFLVLTDSGGLQEEAPVLGKPVLVLREETERSEVIEAGVGALIGTDHDRIVDECSRLLLEPGAYAKMARKMLLFGDGQAAARIAAAIEKTIGLRSPIHASR